MKLNNTQWIAIAGSVILLLGIYLFADTKKIPVEKPEGPMASRDAAVKEVKPFDWDGYMKKVKATITSQDTLKLIADMESKRDEKGLVAFYHKKGESIVEAYYSLRVARVTKDTALARRAGDLFDATSTMTEDESMHSYLSDQAVESYKNVVEWGDSAVANRIDLAKAYMKQGSAPMQGVGILLGIVSKDPDNADAQLLLGQFGIVSRQFDKAIVRLEKVVSLRPQNYDALLLLAQAYEGKGDKAKAIDALEKCAKMVGKPELKKEIEQYITNLKAKS
jgi:tetratricopeptide (TPR) repeat protein